MFDACYRFQLKGSPISCTRYGNGHINETYLVVTDQDVHYILQKINAHVFKHVDKLMENIVGVTQYLAQSDPDPRHVLTVVPTAESKTYLQDADGYWRMYIFVTDSVCLDKVTNEDEFYQSALAFGTFQNQLADYPAHTLHETIPNFHNTPVRLKNLENAIAKDVKGRLKNVQPEVDFVLSRRRDCGYMMGLLQNGQLPLRVTHNDTKLNNVMLDAQSKTPLCVIDLDTVMPGLAANDFGDSIRFGASTAAEDEKDLSKVELSLHLYRIFTRGFLKACGSKLTALEIETLPYGAKLMTMECGIRFLTDYLEGDVYFHIQYPEHNLDRARTQFKLVADMENKWQTMMQIIKEEQQ